MKNTQGRVEALFNIFSKNLTTVLPKYSDVYVCPLCLRIFPKNSIEEGILTVEHIIPNKLKGKIYTLLCKDCNSKCGRDIDYHLIKKIQSEEFLGGYSNKPLNAEIITGDGMSRGDLFIDRFGKPNLKLIGKPNLVHPKKLEESINDMNRDAITITINCNLGFNPTISKIALLKIGYLLLFSCLGYGYILHKPLETIREQILNPEKKLIEPKIFTFHENISDKFKILYTHSPQRYKCFISAIDLSTNIKRSLGIVLPGLNDFNCDIYNKLCGYDPITNSEKLLMSEIIYEPQWLVEPQYSRRAESIWFDNSQS